MLQSNRLMIPVLLIFGISLFQCQEKEKKDSDLLLLAVPQGGQEGSPSVDLPEPALDTATLVLDQNPITLSNAEECVSGNLGLIFSKDIGSTNPPVLNIHLIDMSKDSGIFLESGTPTTGSHLDLDHSDGETYGVVADCPAKVMENTNSLYDLQVLDCVIADNFGNGSSRKNLSFRARCTKS